EEAACGHIKIFGGGGGTILPKEADELHQYGITKIYSPDDGRAMGLEGMIEDVVRQCATLKTPGSAFWNAPARWSGERPLGEFTDIRRVARAITQAEESVPHADRLWKQGVG